MLTFPDFEVLHFPVLASVIDANRQHPLRTALGAASCFPNVLTHLILMSMQLSFQRLTRINQKT
jgi:hypothetical protein